MTTAVIVPWGTDRGPRERVWRFLQPRWEATGLDLIEAADPLFGTPLGHYASVNPDGSRPIQDAHLFSVARAINNAVRLAPEHDAFVLFGADHVPDLVVLDHARRVLERFEWCPLYRRIAYASPGSTEQWIRENPVDLIGTWDEQPQLCPGVLAVRRSLFERVGGMDERYEGWGYEDNAFAETLARTAIGGPPSDSVLRELWHPAGHRDLNGPNRDLYLGGRRG